MLASHWCLRVQNNVALKCPQQFPGSSSVEVQRRQWVATSTSQHEKVSTQGEPRPPKRVQLWERQRERPLTCEKKEEFLVFWARAFARITRKADCTWIFDWDVFSFFLHGAYNCPVWLIPRVKVCILFPSITILIRWRLLDENPIRANNNTNTFYFSACSK